MNTKIIVFRLNLLKLIVKTLNAKIVIYLVMIVVVRIVMIVLNALPEDKMGIIYLLI